MMQTEKSKFDLTNIKQRFKNSNLPVGDLLCAIGKTFLGAPYKPGTLETGHKEKLVVNLAQFDCFTFVETVLALTRCVVAGKMSKSEFRRVLKLIRYRQGIIDGYSSRLHYFTDWLRNNEQKKILRDVSRKLGAVRQRKIINYMTTHRNAYNALSDENEFKNIRLTEKNLSRRIIRLIPKDKVNQQKEKIQTGDIIAFTVEQEGLDVAHVGFALRQGGNLYLLHASSKEGAVVVSAKTLVAYLKQKKKITGIIVSRVL
ncbi:MAG: N-acetylmuramoyl-L-alanine amidase-like domain-containing protein [Smithella sp.]